jgi:thiol-disulfide isomerase/thioredoxin
MLKNMTSPLQNRSRGTTGRYYRKINRMLTWNERSHSICWLATMLIVATTTIFPLSCCSSLALEDTKFASSSLSSSSSTTTTKTHLTKDNFDDITANKTVFIKWAAPWCGHSQELAPAWDQLVATSFKHDRQEDHTSTNFMPHSFPLLLIAEVDCSKEADWCTEMGYTAYPTLTFGDASMQGRYLQTYHSLNRDYESLRQFVMSTLLRQTFCTPGNFLAEGRCSVEEKHRIQTYFDMPVPKLRSFIQREEGLIQAAENAFGQATKEMQTKYDVASKGFEAAKAKIKRQLKLMGSILQQKQQQQQE